MILREVENVNINIKITNKAAYSLILLLVLSVAVNVYAYNSGEIPGVLGHSGEEIELTLPNQEVITLDEFAADVLSNQNQWPAGNYCILEAQNQQCPAGFIATSPSYNGGAGWEFILGAGLPLQPGIPQSAPGIYHVDGGDLKFGNIQGQVWAFCCK